MMRREWIPTPLLDHAQRSPMVIEASARLERWRSVRIVFALGWLLTRLLFLRILGRLTAEGAGQRVGGFLERQGFLWVKLGQLLSLREDVFSAGFCRELARLQFQAKGFPGELARRTIEAELGQPLEEIFDRFDIQPFAAASISQAHRAVLRGSRVEVVVKVQRPDVHGLFARDMAVIGGLVALLQWLRVQQHMRLDDVLWELSQAMLEEIDYRYEMANLIRMRRNLSAHRIYIPKVFEEVSSPRVLVMEFLHGVLMSDYITAQRETPGQLQDWLRENNIDPHRVGLQLFTSFLRQLMEDNLFHGDLHPGNIVLLRNSRIAFIDLGTVGTVETEFLQRYMQSLKAVAEHQYGRAAELGLLLCPDIPPIDVDELKQQLIRCYASWTQRSQLEGVPYGERSVMSVGNDTSEVLMSKRVVLSMMYLKMARTWGTLDASLAYLIPNADYPRLIRFYFRQAQRRARRMPRRDAVLAALLRTREATAEWAQLLAPTLNRQALDFQEETSKFAFLIGTLLGGLRAGVALIAAAWAVQILDDSFHVILPVVTPLAQGIPAPFATDWRLAIVVALLVIVYLGLSHSMQSWYRAAPAP